ncbi:MAG TPA: hypothetical protein DDZ51_06800 [Planctomycetaceae bacterium]|nr:hypothetical protein [Planctomycetaceae bacterium]
MKQRKIPNLPAFRKPNRAQNPLGRGGFANIRPTHVNARRWLMTAIAIGSLAVMPGCNVFAKKDKSGHSEEFTLQASDSADVFKRVREAKSQNSVVVQVIGDSTPVRVLPLPPDERSVFVGDLLKQTGLQESFGPMRVTLYRANVQAPMGIPMEVKFATRGGYIRPETDYALQAGDRIRISKDEQSAWGEMLSQFLPMRGG